MCPSLLNVASPCQWQCYWQPTLGKKENMFSEMSNSDGESSRLELLVHSLAGTFGSLPACLPACLLFLCTLCILAIRIVELIMHFHIFSPSQYVGNSIASVKSNSKSNCRKSKGYPFFFSSILSLRAEKLSGVLTLTVHSSLPLACAWLCQTFY